MPRIVVVGSANVDLVGVADRLPGPGETVLGHDFAITPGGKGANQAVGCASLGAPTSFVGRIGRDAFGRQLRAALDAAGVDLGGTVEDPMAPSGVALIMVDREGHNTILVYPGANGRLTPGDVAAAMATAAFDATLVQLEVPLAAVIEACRRAGSAGARVVLNPAPAQPLSDELLARVDVLTPNQHELSVLAGMPVGDFQEARRAARTLLARGVSGLVVTLGAEGALVVSAEDEESVPSLPVEVVDTTGAGDAFSAALTVALVEGRSLLAAAHFANAAGALATTGLGAQQALPTRAQVLELLAKHRPNWQQG